MDNSVICSRFALHHKLGAGSFGEIYSAEDLVTHKTVAVKLESNKIRSPQLEYEARLYQIMAEGAGIPKLYYFGMDTKHNVMAIDILGKSLEDLLMANKRPLSLKTVLMLADQMIACVQYMHKRHFIHRDIKPDNFVVGLGNTANQVFVIDFGLAKRYRDPKTLQHIPYIENKSLTGTARYASLCAMKGCEQGRRDDMESLGFVLVYLLKGKLPWQGLPARDQHQKMKKILDVKKSTEIEVLCEGLPKQFADYLLSVRRLKFDEEPDYNEYKRGFRELFVEQGFVYDYKYDWNIAATKENNKNQLAKSAKVKFRVQPPPDEQGRQIRPPFTRRYGNIRRSTATANTGNTTAAAVNVSTNNGNNNDNKANGTATVNLSSANVTDPITSARTEKRLRTALPTVPRLPSLPNLTPRINRPQIAPRHYQSRRAVQVGE